MSDTEDGRTDDALAVIERAMVRLRRSMSRRTLGRQIAQERCGPPDIAYMAVVDAVEEGPDPDTGGVTVGMVGERMGIDPSRASRVVSAALKAGYLRRVASQDDARRVFLELTAAGARLADEGHRFRRGAFNRAMEGWTEADRRAFARLLARFTGLGGS